MKWLPRLSWTWRFSWTGYKVPEGVLGPISKQRLAECDDRLQRVFNGVSRIASYSVLVGHRNKADQDRAVAIGNSKTPWPTGKHNSLPSKAVDAAPNPVRWEETPANLKRFYFFAGLVLATAASMGIKLRWGGDWDSDHDFSDQTFNDLVHFEVVE